MTEFEDAKSNIRKWHSAFQNKPFIPAGIAPANKDDLIPPLPILTRYRREAGIKAFVKKELFDSRLLDHRRFIEIKVMTTPTLCIHLNTLYYAISQLNKLEDSI